MISSLFTTWPLLAFLASTLVNGMPLQRRTVVHDRRDLAPQRYTHLGLASADEMLHMSISLSMRDSSGLEEELHWASDPKSSSYGQWLSYEEVQSYSSPSRDAIDAVKLWLQSHGVDGETTRLSGNSLKFTTPIGTANQMLNTEYSVYAHTESGTQSVRTLEYSIPEDLQDYIVAIHPTTSFYLPSSAARAITLPGYDAEQSDSSFSNGTLYRRAGPLDMSLTEPAVLHKLYGLPTSPIANSKSGIAVAAAISDMHANKADLAAWLQKWRPDLPQSLSFSEDLVNNAHNSQKIAEADIEADMNIQYTVGLANGIPTTFVKVGEPYQDGLDGFLDLINHFLKQKNPPSVLTSSIGFERENMLSSSESGQLCNAFQQLTSRGVSILWASGNGGVAGDPNNECDGKPFVPIFPTCPFVTVVGATKEFPEVALELSAGGFSNYFPRPQWQQKAVDEYLKKIGPQLYKGLYNAKGRAYPDVSARGSNVRLYWQGKDKRMQGTSGSAPIFASTIALLNHELTAKGKPPMGFLNPWIYSHPEAFNDIKSGNNPGCGTDGFHALEGWDPVTGMGTPNYPAMKKAIGL